MATKYFENGMCVELYIHEPSGTFEIHKEGVDFVLTIMYDSAASAKAAFQSGEYDWGWVGNVYQEYAPDPQRDPRITRWAEE
jgi:ABC-type transport system substrate-binding protein